MLQSEKDGAVVTIAIPSTLRELLTARLDALSASAHETVELAAALGREVAYPVLGAVVPKDDWVLRQDLAELVDNQWFVQDPIQVMVASTAAVPAGDELDVEVTVAIRIPYIIIGRDMGLVQRTHVQKQVVVQ